MPEMPEYDAGMRTLPPVSVPRAPRNMPAATPEPEPELDPPGQVSASHALRGTGYGLEASGKPQAYSMVVVLPTMTAPAPRRRDTTGASRPDHQDSSYTTLWAVVGPSLQAMMSFTP